MGPIAIDVRGLGLKAYSQMMILLLVFGLGEPIGWSDPGPLYGFFTQYIIFIYISNYYHKKDNYYNKKYYYYYKYSNQYLNSINNKYIYF